MAAPILPLPGAQVPLLIVTRVIVAKGYQLCQTTPKLRIGRVTAYGEISTVVLVHGDLAHLDNSAMATRTELG